MNNDFQPAPKRQQPQPLDNASADPVSRPARSFRTPDEIAAADVLSTSSQLQPDSASTAEPQGWFTRHWPPSKKFLIFSLVILLLVAGGLFYLLANHHPKKVVTAVHTIASPISKPAVPTTVASTLTGLPVAPAVNSRPVTGIMIENSTFARPQSGLSQAGVVFEALAEGGVTRFLALYQDQLPSNVGPIRSLRPYYLQWDLGFDAPIAHVGGSPEALTDVKTWGAPDLDEFANGNSYHRITSRDAPHNVYTSLAILNQLEASKGYASSTYSGFLRKTDSPLKVPTAKTIDINLSASVYNVNYVYNPATNSYYRSEGGAVQTDANTGTQLSPKVVVAMVVPFAQGALDASDAYYSDYTVIGTGTAYVFQDGGVTVGTWTKTSNASQITFAGPTGRSLPLNTGQTWITAITTPSDVTYAP